MEGAKAALSVVRQPRPGSQQGAAIAEASLDLLAELEPGCPTGRRGILAG